MEWPSLAALLNIIVKKAQGAVEATLKKNAALMAALFKLLQAANYTPSSSTSKIRVAFGGITPPAPRAP